MHPMTKLESHDVCVVRPSNYAPRSRCCQLRLSAFTVILYKRYMLSSVPLPLNRITTMIVGAASSKRNYARGENSLHLLDKSRCNNIEGLTG